MGIWDFMKGNSRNGSSVLTGLWTPPSSTGLISGFSYPCVFNLTLPSLNRNWAAMTVRVAMLNPIPFCLRHWPLLSRKQNWGFPSIHRCKGNLVSSKVLGNWIWLSNYHQTSDLLGLSSLGKCSHHRRCVGEVAERRESTVFRGTYREDKQSGIQPFSFLSVWTLFLSMP